MLCTTPLCCAALQEARQEPLLQLFRKYCPQLPPDLTELPPRPAAVPLVATLRGTAGSGGLGSSGRQAARAGQGGRGKSMRQLRLERLEAEEAVTSSGAEEEAVRWQAVRGRADALSTAHTWHGLTDCVHVPRCMVSFLPHQN